MADAVGSAGSAAGATTNSGQKWAIGALADYDFASLKGDMTRHPLLNRRGERQLGLGSGRPLGYLPWDTLIVFISGGYTQAILSR